MSDETESTSEIQSTQAESPPITSDVKETPVPSPTSELPTAPTKIAETFNASVPKLSPLVAPPPLAPPSTKPDRDVVLIAPPVERPLDGMRLRMKVWTHPTTKKRYLAPTAVLIDVHHRIFTVYLMADDGTTHAQLTVDEWNALPFFYFKEDGPAPRGAPRPPDHITLK